MCGIAGLKISEQKGRTALPRMLEAMRLRGPDFRSTHSFGDTSIGHCRLKIIDLSDQANQPLANEDGRLWLVANGEIYNHVQLRMQLQERGHIFRSLSDNEVILHGYEEWGVSCFPMLRGMFAFCLFDQGRDSLVLVRDRLGIKPLYYYQQGNELIFASQVKAILASGLVPGRLCPGAVASFLDSGGVREPLTIIDGVFALAPGQAAFFGPGGLKLQEYWRLLDSVGSAKKTSFGSAAEETAVLLEESMRLHMVSDVPLGVFLSGGIDSSSLLSVAAGMNPGKVRTVSLVFKEQEFDERLFSRLIAQKYGTDHCEIELCAQTVCNDLGGAIAAMDQPTFDGINSYFVSRAAKEAGLTVVISGLGSDEIFCGYPSFRSVPALNSLSRMLRFFPRCARGALAGFYSLLAPDRSGKAKILEFIREGQKDAHPYFLVRRLFSGMQRASLMDGEFDAGISFPGDILKADIYNQVSYLELTQYMKDILLRDTDSMSMAHSLEVRVPFLDHLLVQQVLSFPGALKIGAGANKPLLLAALRAPLPEAITRRKKMGFVFPFDAWLRNSLRQKICDEFSGMPQALSGLILADGAEAVWKGFIDGRISWQRPWALYVLYAWVRNTI